MVQFGQTPVFPGIQPPKIQQRLRCLRPSTASPATLAEVAGALGSLALEASNMAWK